MKEFSVVESSAIFFGSVLNSIYSKIFEVLVDLKLTSQKRRAASRSRCKKNLAVKSVASSIFAKNLYPNPLSASLKNGS